MSDRISKDASEAWRDHVLKQVVDYLETHREAIIDGFEAENAHNLKREDIEPVSYTHLTLPTIYSV